jgi:hypothetical protein
MDLSRLFRSRLERELDTERADLRAILLLPDNSERVKQLRGLATKLGASTIMAHPGHGEAQQPELVNNIHMALQTKAMMATVKTSSCYVVVTAILALIAFASMVASYIAAFRCSP